MATRASIVRGGQGHGEELALHLGEVFGEFGREFPALQEGGQFMVERGIVIEGEVFSLCGSRKKSKGLKTAISTTTSTSMLNSLVFSGMTSRARKFDWGSCCQFRKCFSGVTFEGVAQDARAGMRGGTQADDLGPSSMGRS